MPMAKIKKILAYEIIDSRSFPTIEAKMILDNGHEVLSAIPAGTSVGKYEAHELRDGDMGRFDGMGVKNAVNLINNTLGPKLIGVDPLRQSEIDQWLVGVNNANSQQIGSNTTLAISQLTLKAGAAIQGIPLFKYVNQLFKKIFKTDIKLQKIPTPIFNVINGGKHANNNLDIQEFQLIPSSRFSFTQAYEVGVELFHEIEKVLIYRNANISVGEEGGFAPNLSTNVDAFEILDESISRRNLKPGMDVFLGMDMAASRYFKDQRYVIRDKPQPLNRNDYIDFILKLLKDYSFLVVEDPLNQDDFEGWIKLNKLISDKIYLIGDDLLVTNKERLQMAIKEKACNAILIKPNQIGTITQTLEVVSVARQNDFTCIVSHRSGETNDDLIADFAVGIQSEFVKFGAPSRGERVAKYNRLWQIERQELK